MRILTLLLVLANVVVLALWSGALPGTSERDPARFDRQISAERLQIRRVPAPEPAVPPAAPTNAEAALEPPAASAPTAPPATASSAPAAPAKP